MKSIGNLRINNTLVVIYLLLISNAIIAPLLFKEQSFADESSVLKILKYLPILLFFIVNSKISIEIKKADKVDKILGLFVGICLFSVIWSPAKGAVLGNSIQFAIFFYFLFFLKHNGYINIKKVFSTYLALIILFSFFTYYALPAYGQMSGFHQGLARGAFFHKNILGSTLTLFLPFLLVYEGRLITKVLALLSMTYLIILSGSSTSLIAIVFISLLSLLTTRLNKTGLILMIFAVVFSGIYIYVNFSGLFFNALGKSDDLTGRLLLWENIIQAIKSRPFLGYGYWGFWNSEFKGRFFYEMDWITGKSHNAFLDILLSGGYVLLIIGLLLIRRIFLEYSSFSDKRKRSYAILTFFAVLMLCLTEIGLIEHNNINLLVLFLIPKFNV